MFDHVTVKVENEERQSVRSEKRKRHSEGGQAGKEKTGNEPGRPDLVGRSVQFSVCHPGGRISVRVIPSLSVLVLVETKEDVREKPQRTLNDDCPFLQGQRTGVGVLDGRSGDGGGTRSTVELLTLRSGSAGS